MLSLKNCCNKQPYVTLADDVTDVPSISFEYCISLSVVTMGNSVISNGERVFDCPSIASVIIPSSVVWVPFLVVFLCPR
jgi:BspA type Leucine rich repeat region (6 copies)